MAIKTMIHGASGYMGRIMERLLGNDPAFEIVAKVSADGAADCLQDINDYTGDLDMIIDFSHRSATKGLLDYAERRGAKLLLATTGQTPEEREMIKKAAEQIPVFFSPTMSPAIAMLCKMVAEAARMFPDADIELIEYHHNRKVDVPSGTALMLANALLDAVEGSTLLIGRHENGKRKPREIAVHSLRIGNKCGTHEVIICTGTQTITFRHEAESRELFAEGAVVAAKYLAGKGAGLYTMHDLMKENA